MQAFWSGVREQGWPIPPADLKGFASVVSRHVTVGEGAYFSENSYAILSREYMMASLRMGYHFTTVESMSSEDCSKNFICLQFKQGGASYDRRIRRLRLITGILSTLGFENASKGDFLDSRIAYMESKDILYRLRIIGRLTMMTKQLDMALSNDAVTDWYMNDFKKKLGLVVDA
jgi:pyruvate,water dikinase